MMDEDVWIFEDGGFREATDAERTAFTLLAETRENVQKLRKALREALDAWGPLVKDQELELARVRALRMKFNVPEGWKP